MIDKLGCVIIGSGTLPLRCAEILLEKGHSIRALVSNDEDAAAWADKHGVTRLNPSKDLAGQLGRFSFDFLFSIVNEHILREDVLRLPKKLAVNYHDSPLPKYAGTHATSWALINGETSHAVSWHEITDTVDAGDVLKQKNVVVSPDDTAFTLNAKCYEAAIEAFAELIDELATGSANRTKQDLDQRTFFPRYKRPNNGCVISWKSRASEISALVRALNFGNYPNPLGRPKIAVDTEFIIVPEIEVLDLEPLTAPGTINEINRDFIQISAADREVRLRRFLRLDGRELSLAELVEEFHLHEGCRLNDLKDDAAEKIGGLYREIAKFENYWIKKLESNEPAAIPLSKKTRVASGDFASLPVALPPETLNFLRKSGAGRKPGVFLAAAFGAFLSRINRSEVLDAGFAHSELEKQTGGTGNLFAALLPFRFEIDDGQDFETFYDKVEREYESLKKHKTFARDIFTRCPELRATAENAESFGFPAAMSEVEELSESKPVFGAELTMAFTRDAARCVWIYDRSRLFDEDIENLSRSFSTFLKAIASDPAAEIARLPLLSEDEQKKMLVEWNGAPAAYPKDKCVHHLFEERVERAPDAVALVSGEDRLTYRELNRRANRLAHRLIDAGVKPETPVGIYVERSIDLIVSVLGVLKAGGAYVSLDPSYPAQRLDYIVENAELKFVLARRKDAAAFPSRSALIIDLDDEREQIAEYGAENPNAAVAAENAAYVIYTSGSTGKPKGVVVPHAPLVNHCFAIADLYEIGENDRVLQFASFNFDVSAEELFPTLARGARLVLLPERLRADLAEFTKFLDAEKITVANLPASYWHQWITSLAGAESALPEALRLLVTGSERVLAEDFRLWREIAGESVRWINAYGLTETTITSIAYDPARKKSELDQKTIPIGRPIKNTKAYLLDRNLQPVPAGIPGDLYIGGACLARGYLNAPHMTAERFLPDPFDPQPGARIYETGDLARFLSGGELEYLDRVDNQVKIRGHRIELGEIEAALTKHAEVVESAVALIETEENEPRLTAYIVPDAKALSGNRRTQIWASVEDYSVYVELPDFARKIVEIERKEFEEAIREHVRGKTVLAAGGGNDLHLARLCVEAKARRVYAVAPPGGYYAGAKKLLEDFDLFDRLVLLDNNLSDFTMPEKADVCVIEPDTFFSAGECFEKAKKHLEPDAVTIPENRVTKMAAVRLPDDLRDFPHFTERSKAHLESIFSRIGHRFDPVLCLRNFKTDNIISDAGVCKTSSFEPSAGLPDGGEVFLKIDKESRIDGFIMWRNIRLTDNAALDDETLFENRTPIYFPVFERQIRVRPGDVVKAICVFDAASDKTRFEYRISGVLHRKNDEDIEFSYTSPRVSDACGQTEFYRRLFAGNSRSVRKKFGISVRGLRRHLTRHLPGYMIPSAFIELDELPLTANGKVDRSALPAPENFYPENDRARVAPRTAEEKLLVKIWEEILEIEPIGVKDDFFELGGESLKAIRMFAQVEKRFGRNLPLAMLFQAPTIERLAAVIREEGNFEADESSLVPIQPKGDKPPFFCIHAKGGNVLFYRDLARRLGTEQPFYGLQARRLDGRQVGHDTVEEMAEFYIREIQTLQPEGPYYLGGSSFGGLAAFEMAQRLRRMGHEVALLALLDTGTPDYPKILPGTTRLRAKFYEIAERVGHHKQSLKLLDWRGRIEYFGGKLKKIWRRYFRIANNIYREAGRRYYRKVKGSVPKNFIQAEDKIERAGQRYAPEYYPGRMVLFRATNQPLGIYPDPTLGWKDLAAEIEIHEVPGHHGSIVAEPYVRALAEKLRRRLDRAQAEATKAGAKKTAASGAPSGKPQTAIVKML